MNSYLIKNSSISLINKKIEDLIKELNFKGSSITTYDLEEDSINLLIEDADTISFLTPRKVIIGKNLSNNNFSDISIKTLSKYLDNPNNDVLLIFTTTNIDTRKKIVKEVINKLTLVNISSDTKEIIKDILKDYDVEYRVINLLEEYYSDDLERLINETKKLALSFINTKKITYKDTLNLFPLSVLKFINSPFEFLISV